MMIGSIVLYFCLVKTNMYFIEIGTQHSINSHFYI